MMGGVGGGEMALGGEGEGEEGGSERCVEGGVSERTGCC